MFKYIRTHRIIRCGCLSQNVALQIHAADTCNVASVTGSTSSRKILKVSCRLYPYYLLECQGNAFIFMYHRYSVKFFLSNGCQLVALGLPLFLAEQLIVNFSPEEIVGSDYYAATIMFVFSYMIITYNVLFINYSYNIQLYG